MKRERKNIKKRVNEGGGVEKEEEEKGREGGGEKKKIRMKTNHDTVFNLNKL